MPRKKKLGTRLKRKKTWRLHTKLRPMLRRLWFYSPMRREAVKRANGQCEACHTPVWSGSRAKGIKGNLEVDHIVPCGTLEGDINGFCDRLFCSSEGLKVLCSTCHSLKKASAL
jgi:hypothetical protein